MGDAAWVITSSLKSFLGSGDAALGLEPLSFGNSCLGVVIGMGMLDEAVVVGPPSLGAELPFWETHPLPSPRACPECRVTSSYYIPHKYWVSDVAEKEKLINTFKARTG